MNQPILLIEDDYNWDGTTEYDILDEIKVTGNKGLVMLVNNINRRAARLWEQGYTHQDMEGVPNGFLVITPTGTYAHRVYTYPNIKPVCTCQSYRKWTYCKHSEAVAAMLKDQAEQEAAQVAAYEAMIAGAENEGTGCDPFAEY